MTNVIAFTGKVRYRRGHLNATRDFLVIREDGSLGFAPKQPAPPPPRIGSSEIIDDLEDLQAGMRLAREAAERDD